MIQQITPPGSANNSQLKTRSAGLDIVRTIACLTVIASHYFLYSDFNKSEFVGISMFLQGMLSSIAIGSDLYMILTGFLCCNKIVSKKFYLSGIKVLLSYVFFSLLTIVVNIYWFHTGMTWKSGLMGILSFSTIPYAWYIEMWIGLFLMAPFLNIWYKALPSKHMKLSLIVLLFAFSALPDFFNRYGFYLVPKFWENIYPIAFYLTGSFIREYQPNIRWSLLIPIILSIMTISSAVTSIIGYPTFLHIIGDRNGAFLATIAICIFLLFYNTDVRSQGVKTLFKMISLRSLDIFLCSAVMDYYIYPLFRENFFVSQPQYGLFYFIIIPTIFVICYAIASGKRLIFTLAEFFTRKLGLSIALQSKG